MKKLLFISILIFGLFCMANSTYAADKYVRKGASGGGTSWSDAYGEFSSVSTSGMSGSTLWVAAGSYTSGLGDLNITNLTIKRATVSSHGTETGWNAAYDGQVTVTPSGPFFEVPQSGGNVNGLVMDGASNNPWKFRIVGVKGLNGMILVLNTNGITIRNIEWDGNREGGDHEDGMRFSETDNVVIEHCYIHDYVHLMPAHNDGIQHFGGTGFTFRYNISKNNGQHMILGETAWGNSTVDDANISYNLFYNDNTGSYNTIVSKGTGAKNWKIENNTFAIRCSTYDVYSAISHSGANPSNYYVRNNIFYDSIYGDVAGNSYNTYYLSGTAPSETGRVTANPLFTNLAGNNFTLQSGSPSRNAGTALGYTQDLIGTAVPQDSVTDMGAYEFSGTAPVNTVPAAPTGVKVV